MDEVIDKFWHDADASLSRSLPNELSKSREFDRNLVKACSSFPQLAKIHQDEYDVYILWLRENLSPIEEAIHGVKIRAFYSNEDLVEFITEIPTSNIFLIIDKTMAAITLPLLEDLSQILFVYVLTTEENRHRFWVFEPSKVVIKTSDDRTELFQAVMGDIDACTNDMISTTIFDLTDEEESTNSIEMTSSIWYQLLFESLFSLAACDTTAKDDLITYCRQQYPADDHPHQRSITEFEQQYVAKDAIRWYTRNSFIYRLLNKALRMRSMDTIFKFRFFILDLQQQLEQTFDEELTGWFPLLYRGQQMSRLELAKLQKSKGKYISINTYLSTSIDEEVALRYATGEPSVLFQIDVDMEACIRSRRLCPTYVQPLSYFPDEYEVVFPFGAIFRVNEVEKRDGRWLIHLTLTNHDNTHKERCQYIEQINSTQLPSTLKFINLLIQTNDFDTAERVIEILLNDVEYSSDNLNMRYICDLKGQICSSSGDYKNALVWFNKALSSAPSATTHCEMIHFHLGNMYFQQAEYDKALHCYNTAQEQKQNIDWFYRASLCHQLGYVHQQLGNFDEALDCLFKTLEIHRLHLSHQMNGADIYSSIASMLTEQKNFNRALEYEKSALHVLSRVMPKDHPTIVSAYIRIGDRYSRCGQYKSAIIYYRKALNIERTLRKIEDSSRNFDPIAYVFICIRLGTTYGQNGDLFHLQYYVNDAIETYTQLQSKFCYSNSILYRFYNVLVTAFTMMADFPSVFNYLGKAFHVAKGRIEQSGILSTFLSFYLLQRDTKASVRSLIDLIKCDANLNSSFIDLDRLTSILRHITAVYELCGNRERTIYFTQAELHLRYKAAEPDFERIASIYKQLAPLCPNEQITYYNKAIDILINRVLPITKAKWLCHRTIGLLFIQLDDVSQAAFHMQSAVEHLLKMTSPSYYILLGICNMISTLYCDSLSDLNAALFYNKISHDVWLHLMKTKKVPINDRAQLRLLDGHFSERIEQSRYLMGEGSSTYSGLVAAYGLKGDPKQALEFCLKREEIIQEYHGEEELMDEGGHCLSMGYDFRRVGKFDQAIAYITKSVEYDMKDYHEYGCRYWILGFCYYQHNDNVMAISVSKKALTFLHNATVMDHKIISTTYRLAAHSYIRVENYEHAFIYYEQAIRNQLLCNPIDRRFIGRIRLEQADCVYSSKRWNSKEALSYYLKALGGGDQTLTTGQLGDCNESVGVIYLRDNDCVNALEYFHRALQYQVKTRGIHQWIGVTYCLAGDFKRAYEYARRDLASQLGESTIDSSDLSDTYIDIGVIQYRLGRYQSALKWYNRAFHIQELLKPGQIGKNYYVIHSNIGRIYYEYGQMTEAWNRCVKARDCYFSVSQDENPPTNLYIHLGLIECKRKQYYNALSYFGQAFEIIYNKKHNLHLARKILFNYIGYAYFKLGHIQVALANYLKSLALYNACNPNHPDLAQVYKNIGLICEEVEHDYPLALLFYKRALELVPNCKHLDYIRFKVMIILLEYKHAITAGDQVKGRRQ